MNVRLTGISSPVGGLSWEYIEDQKKVSAPSFQDCEKIKVFISSKCDGKYTAIRAELKAAIEQTQLAKVYLFEDAGASTKCAGDHYKLALQDSDVCIFLIDNADGIPEGVQVELNNVNKYHIKALYYFCDEKQNEPTPLQKSLMGAQFAKSKTVHSFSDLSENGAKDLIDDILGIYHDYCKNRLIFKEDDNDFIQESGVVGTENYQLPVIPKSVIQNVDKCGEALMQFVLGRTVGRVPFDEVKTSENDEWGLEFLSVLLNGRSIKNFNTSMFLELLKKQQNETYHNIVEIRWKAIQAYFSDDVEKCISYLETAQEMAKSSHQASWVIKDILIDLRNQQWTHNIETGRFSELDAQKELDESEEHLYYPILDRLHESLYQKYYEGLYKKTFEPPYSVTISNNICIYCNMIAGSLIVAMYNGSLTHMLMIYKQLKELSYYLSSKYSDWEPRFALYKLAVFEGKENDIKRIQDTYPEILNQLDNDEAVSIFEFCLNHPLKYQKQSAQLKAFGAVGYFLDDKNYSKYEKVIIDIIQSWLDHPEYLGIIGQSIVKCLSGVAVRMSQDTLVDIFCQFFDKHYSRWYRDIFKLIAQNIELSKMSLKSSQSLVEHICSLLEDEKDFETVKQSPSFLYVLRKQNYKLTEKMDQLIKEKLPDYYREFYKLETTENEKEDIPAFVQKYIEIIRRNNIKQGENGVFFGSGYRYIVLIRNILRKSEIAFTKEIMDSLIASVSDTLLYAKEGIRTKIDAISLLICIVEKHPEDYERNQEKYQKLFEEQDNIEASDSDIFSENINNVALKIALQFLFVAMEKDVHAKIMELMPYINGDITTTIEVSRVIVEYMEITGTVKLPEKIEMIVLQNVLQWLQSYNNTIRWNATRLLLFLARNPENSTIVNEQVIRLINTANVYIKNLIIRNMQNNPGITAETRQYVYQKCKTDSNFVVRMVCNEMGRLQLKESDNK